MTKWAGAGVQTWDLLVHSNLFPLTLSPFLYFGTLFFLWLSLWRGNKKLSFAVVSYISSHLHLSFIPASKVRSLPWVRPTGDSVRLGSGLGCKYWTSLELIDNVKHSSLLQNGILKYRPRPEKVRHLMELHFLGKLLALPSNIRLGGN